MTSGDAFISLALSPRGHLHVTPAAPGSPPLPPETAQRIAEAFARGPGEGLFDLGAVEVGSELPSVFAYWRDIGHLFMERLCALPDLETRGANLQVPAPGDELALRAAGVPPMAGAEYLTPAFLEEIWTSLNAAAAHDRGAWKGDVASWLKSKNAVWNLVGRVWFHLAEKKGDDRTPFAFLATYTARVGGAAHVKHVPLGRALQEYAGAREKQRLLALLAPLHRAAERSPLVGRLVESGEVFHPLAFPVRDAHGLLRDIPVLEESGLIVRVPDWWNPRRPRRPSVTVTLGDDAPKGLGLGALLDFSVEPTLDGEKLTSREWKQLLEGADGLALLRGKWVEVDRERLKDVLDRWHDLKRALAEGVPFAEAMRLLSGVSQPTGGGEGMDGDGELAFSRVEAGVWLGRVLAELRSPGEASLPDPGAGLRTPLRPYQEIGVRWLFTLGRLGLGACLADDMGLGKTIQVLSLLLSLKRRDEKGPHLLVVPASLIANWQAEIERFAPDLSLFVAHASVAPRDELASLNPKSLKGTDVVITTYGSLLRFPWLTETAWSVVCLDEAQAIKNPDARQTRAAKALKGRVRLALTGTPVENRLSDLWSIFDFLSPGLLGSAPQFAELSKRLAARTPPDYGPLRSLVRPYILRRLKTDRSVIADLPEKTEMKAFCPLSKAQAALYQRSVEELGRLLTTLDGMQRRGVVLAFLMRLKQICNHPSHWTGDGGWAPKESGKFGRLAQLCEEIAARQEKALVFTQFREATEPLAAYLAGVFGRKGLVLSGHTPVTKRKQRVDSFQREDGPPFFVLSVKAGGTGLNLTAASHVIHFDRWWNPAVEDQATDRAFRIGQKKNVLVHKFVCRGTVEERIDALIEGKRSLSRELLDGCAETLITEMTNDELLKLVSLDVTSALAEA
jgi:non-specific serine/threonine protein kinase